MNNILAKKNLWSPVSKVLFLLVMLCGFQFSGYSIDDSLKFTYPKQTIELGSIEDGTVLDFKFTVTNNYDTIVEVMQIHPSCGCTIVETQSFKLSPGESKEISIKFNSSGRIGPNYKEIHVLTDKGMLTVSFNVTVVEKKK